jgi:hypothetical protein
MRNPVRVPRRLAALAALAAVSALAYGCFDSGIPEEVAPPASSYPFPDTADQLMANFRAAWDSMDIDEYSYALHADFVFVFADGCPVAPSGGAYTRAEELLHTGRIFAGEPGFDQIGQLPKPGVRDVDFPRLDRLTDWEGLPADDPRFPGALCALFDVRIGFYLDGVGQNTIAVDSQQLFYVKAVDEPQRDGGTRQRFCLIGQRDLDNEKANAYRREAGRFQD